VWQFPESTWTVAGNVYDDGTRYHITMVEVEGLGIHNNAAHWRAVYRGTIERGLIVGSPAYWQKSINLTKITGENLGDQTDGAWLPVLSLTTAPNYGTVNISMTYSGSGNPKSEIVVKVRIFGGGKFEAA
jgi:hypothetical protein